METVTLSSKFQLVVPRGARERLQLRPGMRITVLDKGGVIFLVPERPIRAYRDIARGTFLSIKAVEANLTRLYRRYGVRNRDQLARTVENGG